MQDVYKNIEEYNPGKKRKISIVFGDMISDMINGKYTLFYYENSKQKRTSANCFKLFI